MLLVMNEMQGFVIYIMEKLLNQECEMMDWHSMTYQQTAQKLDTNISRGLSSAQAEHRLAEFGKNTLSDKKKQSIPVKFISQFKDFMVLILLIASGISFFTAFASEDGDLIDPIMILVIVIVNAIVGTVQECRAEKAIDALKKLSSPHARVTRNGKLTTIPSEELAVGDIVTVEAGDLICADCRLIDSSSLKVEESALTGESVPSDKNQDMVLSADTPLGDRNNMLYSSTFVTAGHGKAIVVATGMHTQVGKIAEMIDSEQTPDTPLQKSLAKTGKILGISALLICIVIFVLGLIQKVPPLEMFMISISLAVAAIPEGLPAVVTIVLALGVRKMALHRAIIRHLPAVETLGSARVICSDKTGTLTQNKMTVVNISSLDGTVTDHSADGQWILSLAALCSNSVLSQTAKGFHADGEPTENALVIACAKAGKPKNQLDREFQRVHEIPFDSAKKRMITVHQLSAGGYRVIAKGACDVLVSLCGAVKTHSGISQMNGSFKSRIHSLNNSLAQQAMRVIAVAYKDCPTMPRDGELEKNLIFCGLIGMTDPPRPQAKAAVAQCRKAGIHTVMITGDHIITARAVAKEIGIYREGDKAVTGAELDMIPQNELERDIYQYSVFARVSPEHKVRIVKAFQARGAVTAMTGDGVNDAPALKCADIGCAMGICGTDVAKGSADMILTDDNFATIVGAVGQGRGIFGNIKKTVHFLLSSNIGEILTVLCAFLCRLPSPLLAIQLLWVNLVTDSLPALALGVEPAEPDIMEKPSDTNHSIFSGGVGRSIVIEGCFIGALAFLAFTIGRVFFDKTSEPLVARTMTFAVLSLSQLVHSFNLKSEKSLFQTGIFGNAKLIGAFIIGTVMQVSVISVPLLAGIFKAVPLTPLQWLITALLSVVPLIVVETEKLLSRRKA